MTRPHGTREKFKIEVGQNCPHSIESQGRVGKKKEKTPGRGFAGVVSSRALARSSEQEPNKAPVRPGSKPPKKVPRSEIILHA